MRFMNKIFLLINTLRYLRFSQFYHRLVRRFYRPAVTTPAVKVANPLALFRRFELYNQSILSPTRARFLNMEGDIGGSTAWNDESKAKLWLYNLHYFDDLNALDAEERIDTHLQLMRRWIGENPAPMGVGWEPYPSSLHSKLIICPEIWSSIFSVIIFSPMPRR